MFSTLTVQVSTLYSLLLLVTLGPLFVLGDSTKTLGGCVTGLGTAAVNPVPTNSLYITLPAKATVKLTSTPVTTVTPATSTSTVSTTTTFTSTTTAVQETDTFTSSFTTTSTSTTTTTITVPTTSTATTTTTISSTTTIQPPSGFVPANQVLHKKRAALSDAHEEKRDVLVERADNNVRCSRQNGKVTFSPAVFPTRVVCGGLVIVTQTSTSTATASTTQTITAATPSATTTTTFSTTVTSTTVPVKASTTVTTTISASTVTTASTTTTTTFTTTSTVTINVPAATYYAACGPDNQLSTVNGVPINGGQFYNGATNPGAGSAYDCCVACQRAANCGGYIFFPGPFCYNANKNGNTCSPPPAALGLYLDSAGTPDVVAGSGACGTVNLAP